MPSTSSESAVFVTRLQGLPPGVKLTAVVFDSLKDLPMYGVIAARGSMQLETDNVYDVINLAAVKPPIGWKRDELDWFRNPRHHDHFLSIDGKVEFMSKELFYDEVDARRIILKPVPAEPAPLKGFLCQNCSRVEVDGQGFVCDACIKMWTKPLAGSFAAKIIAAAVEDERMLAKESGIPAPKDAAVFDSLVEIATGLHYDAKDRVRAAELLMIAKGYNVIPASS